MYIICIVCKPCLYFTIVYVHSLGIYCGLKKVCKSLKTLVWSLIQRPLSHQFLEPFMTLLPHYPKKYLLTFNTKVNFYSIFSYVTHCARVSWFWESLSLTSTDVDMKPREKKNISSRSSSVLPSHSC